MAIDGVTSKSFWTPSIKVRARSSHIQLPQFIIYSNNKNYTEPRSMPRQATHAEHSLSRRYGNIFVNSGNNRNCKQPTSQGGAQNVISSAENQFLR